MKFDITHALTKLYPEGAKFVQEGTEYSGLNWFDKRPKPTQKQLNDKVAELQADYDAKKYQRDRASAYPSWQDQMEYLFHLGYDGWKAELQKGKDEFPKT